MSPLVLALSALAFAATGEAGGGTGPPGSESSAVDLTVARLQYGGGGDWYANPSSLPNLLSAIRTETGIRVSEREAVVTPSDPGIRDYPFIHMTGHGNVAFSPEERASLRAYLESGGFLHADDNYGMDESFRREIALIFPDRPLVELPPDHPIFHVFNDFPDGLPKIHEHDGGPPQAFAIVLEGRVVVFYSYESDLGDGWEDPEVHGDPEAAREAALRMGVNLFVYAMSRTAR